MVNIVPTAQVRDDAPRVLHEDNAIRLKRDGHWTFLNRTSQLFRVHWRDIHKGLDPCSLFGPVRQAAISCQSFVRVVHLVHDAVILRVPECTIHCST